MKRSIELPAAPRVDLTAMIDAIFILLIFWMTVARLAAGPDAVPLETPTADGTPAVDIPRDVLTIHLVDGDPGIIVAGVPMTVESLVERIGAGPLPQRVVIRASSAEEAARVQAALSALRLAGIQSVGVAVREDRT
ncbi:MAG: biopolymer transporter ExbD [Phycisphaerales bacterium]|nr:MAG: biopolymer transporter ExbD [Phycisphaerales bacterium]